MAQPLLRLAGQQLLRLCQRNATSGERLEPVLAAQCVNGCHRVAPYSSDKRSKVLSHSTLLLQDGLDIQELPLLIRRMDAREFPFTTAMYTGESLRKVSEQEEAFKLHLMDSLTLREVFRLLEVPGDKVTAYSAAFALQRLCNLQEGREETQSFVRKAILNELCETVTRDIHTLTNETVINLIKCYLISSNYEERYIEKINDEIERRLGDGLFEISELCSVIDLLSSFAKGSQSLVNDVWIHLGSRYGELDQNNLPRVFKSVKYLSPSQKFLWKLLDKRVMAVWWKLDADDVALVMQRMTLGNHFHSPLFVLMGKWLLTNIHDIKDSHLKEIVAANTYFSYSDANIMKALERYVGAKSEKMSKTVLAMVMEHCRRRRHLSTRIFNAVARDFQCHGHSYQSHEVLNALRPFGQLNYLPPNTTQLFLTVEEVLTKTFNDFDAASMIELLASFVYIERFPVNFLNKIFTPHFLAKVKRIPHAPIRHKTGRHLMELQAAVVLEFPKQYLKPVDGDSLGLTLTWLENRYFKFHIETCKVLTNLLGSGNFYEVEVPRNTPHIIDFQINISKTKKPMRATRDSLDRENDRLALVGVLPESFCANTNHPLGELAMKKRHLELLGYTVVEVSYETFTWRLQSAKKKREYLEALLSPYISFPEASEWNAENA